MGRSRVHIRGGGGSVHNPCHPLQPSEVIQEPLPLNLNPHIASAQPGSFLSALENKDKSVFVNPFCVVPKRPSFPREARDLISKIRSCTVRSDLK